MVNQTINSADLLRGQGGVGSAPGARSGSTETRSDTQSGAANNTSQPAGNLPDRFNSEEGFFDEMTDAPESEINSFDTDINSLDDDSIIFEDESDIDSGTGDNDTQARRSPSEMLLGSENGGGSTVASVAGLAAGAKMGAAAREYKN